jgi:hypothetical protein
MRMQEAFSDISCIETIARSQSNHNITIQLQYYYTITIS